MLKNNFKCLFWFTNFFVQPLRDVIAMFAEICEKIKLDGRNACVYVIQKEKNLINNENNK